MKTKAFLALTVAALAIALAGCSTQPMSGVVGWDNQSGVGSQLSTASSTPTVGSRAPDIHFTSEQGVKTTLNKVRKPVQLLAFTACTADSCGSIRPEVASLAQQFRGESVSVVQVSLPSGKSTQGSDCVSACNPVQPNVISLCDTQGKAWNLYGQPKSGSVFLIDENDKIVGTGQLGDMKSLANQASKMAFIFDDAMYADIEVGS